MHLFMVVCGYFCNRSVIKYTEKQFVIAKIERLILPIFTFSLISLIMEFPNNIGFSLIAQLIFRFFTSLWFFWGVFIFSILLYIANRMRIDYRLLLAFSIVALMFIPDFPATTAYIKSVFPAFIIGAMMSKQKWDELIFSNITSITISAGLLFIVLLAFYDKDCYVYTTLCNVFGGSKDMGTMCLIDFYRIVIGIVGSIFVIGVIRMLKKLFPDLLLCVFN